MLNDFTDASSELQKLDEYMNGGWDRPCINKVDKGWHVGVEHVYNVDKQIIKTENGVTCVTWEDSPTHVHVTETTLKQAIINAMLKMDEIGS